MTWRAPDVWTFVLLALASYRLYRLGARDTITEPFRAALTYPDETSVTLEDRLHELKREFAKPVDDPERPTSRLEVILPYLPKGTPKGWRVYLATLIRCPWCAGFYVAVGVWIAWEIEPSWTTILAAPWALSAVLGLVRKNLDA